MSYALLAILKLNNELTDGINGFIGYNHRQCVTFPSRKTMSINHCFTFDGVMFITGKMVDTIWWFGGS